jgi:hypothetical protein
VVPAPSRGPWAAQVSSVEAIATPKEAWRRAGALRARSSVRYQFTGTGQLSFLTQLPFSFFSYFCSTALQATRWARPSSPY